MGMVRDEILNDISRGGFSTLSPGTDPLVTAG
jgi:hypothetical protein